MMVLIMYWLGWIVELHYFYEQEIGNNFQRINNNRNALANGLSAIQKLSLSQENVLLARVNVNLYQQLAIISPEIQTKKKQLMCLIK